MTSLNLDHNPETESCSTLMVHTLCIRLLVFEETTVFAVVSSTVPGLSEFYSPLCFDVSTLVVRYSGHTPSGLDCLCSILSVLRAPLFLQFFKSLQLSNLPGDWARELFKPSTDSASLKLQTKKTFSVLDWGFLGMTSQVEAFCFFFGQLYLTLGANPINQYFRSIFF